MTSFVVDASVAIKGFIGEEHSDVAARVLAQPLAAPDLLCAECANILWKKVARDELTFDEVETIISALSKWGIVLYSMHGFWLSATRIACQLNHPAYDCFYLALAEALEVPFVTADDRLVQRVRTSGSPELGALMWPLAEWP